MPPTQPRCCQRDTPRCQLCQLRWSPCTTGSFPLRPYGVVLRKLWGGGHKSLGRPCGLRAACNVATDVPAYAAGMPVCCDTADSASVHYRHPRHFLPGHRMWWAARVCVAAGQIRALSAFLLVICVCSLCVCTMQRWCECLALCIQRSVVLLSILAGVCVLGCGGHARQLSAVAWCVSSQRVYECLTCAMNACVACYCSAAYRLRCQ